MARSPENQLADLYLANADMIAENGGPLNGPRSQALEMFLQLGIPSRGSARRDRYHYTDLRHLFETAYEHYFLPGYTSVSPHRSEIEGLTISLRNGFAVNGPTVVCEPNGVLYGSLAGAAVLYPELVSHFYNRLAADNENPMAQLNTVFAQDGAFIYVPQGVRVDQPFVVTASYYSHEEAVSGFMRHLFIFEEHSEAQIILDHRSLGNEAGLWCQTCEMFVGKEARVGLAELIRFNDKSSFISAGFTAQQASSSLQSLTVPLSGSLVRCDPQVRLAGPGAENHTDALLLCNAGEHFDFTSDIDHVSPDCTSYELVKGVAADNGTGIFCGRIHVAQDAQRTQAFQQNNNLLLGNHGHIYTKPQLEIYADNVKCSHGATVGQLNEEAIYYMRQRGISDSVARRLQLSGFLHQVIEKSAVREAVSWIESLVEDKINKL